MSAIRKQMKASILLPFEIKYNVKKVKIITEKIIPNKAKIGLLLLFDFYSA
jgi:hypothetical protein